MLDSLFTSKTPVGPVPFPSYETPCLADEGVFSFFFALWPRLVKGKVETLMRVSPIRRVTKSDQKDECISQMFSDHFLICLIIEMIL